MILGELIGDYLTDEIFGDMNIDITGINNDSRRIIEGNMFIATKGFNKDGHHFIDSAIENGAICIVHQKNLPYKSGISYIKVKDSIDALGYISSKFYKLPSKKINMIGITGTNGKTSTSYLIKSILDNNNMETGVIGTLGINIKNNIIKLDNTTPESITLQHYLSNIVDENIGNCVMEVSSHALDLKRVDYIDFQIGIFTNLTKDHLDYHMTINNYFNSKLKLFYMTKRCNIINIDDYYGKEIVNLVSDRVKLLTYGINPSADIFATNVEYNLDKVKFTLNYLNQSLDITLNIPGQFSIYNSLAAAACCISMNIDLETIKKGLEDVKGIIGRFEIVPTNKDFIVIIDFAHTPDGLEKVLNVIDKFSEGRKVVIFGAGGDRDSTKRPEMGRVVGKHGDFAIITSDNPRFENPTKIIEDILVGIKETNIEYKIIVDRKEAIKFALDNHKPKDIILLAGKGHEKYTIINGETYPFDERKIILDYLKGM